MHRREYNRFEVNALAILVVNNDLEKTILLKNLSGRGASVIGNCPLQVNNKIEIVIHIPFLCDKPIHKEARVAWCNKVNDELWEGGLDFGLDNKLDLASC